MHSRHPPPRAGRRRSNRLARVAVAMSILGTSCAANSRHDVPPTTSLLGRRAQPGLHSLHRSRTNLCIEPFLTVRGGAADISVHAGASSNNGEVTPRQQQPTAPSSPNQQPSPFEYVPITALDDYGQSTQLRNAMEAATRFGTPVLACLCRHDGDEDGTGENDGNDVDETKADVENAIVVCSLQRPRPGVIAPPASMGSASIANASRSSLPSVHPSMQGMVRLVATRDDVHRPLLTSEDIPQHALHTAIVTTGLQSDASFLLAELQTHLSKHWFRYDALPSAAGESAPVVKMVRDILLDCLGYDRSEEASAGGVSGGIGSAAPSYDERDDDDDNGGSARAGRPLGICSFLLGMDAPTRRPSLTVVRANGASQQYVAHAMGMGSSLANGKLSQRWRLGMYRTEAVGMMREILKDVAKEKGWISNDGGDETNGRGNELTVVCETVTSRGIDTEFVPLL